MDDRSCYCCLMVDPLTSVGSTSLQSHSKHSLLRCNTDITSFNSQCVVSEMTAHWICFCRTLAKKPPQALICEREAQHVCIKASWAFIIKHVSNTLVLDNWCMEIHGIKVDFIIENKMFFLQTLVVLRVCVSKHLFRYDTSAPVLTLQFWSIVDERRTTISFLKVKDHSSYDLP